MKKRTVKIIDRILVIVILLSIVTFTVRCAYEVVKIEKDPSGMYP